MCVWIGCNFPGRKVCYQLSKTDGCILFVIEQSLTTKTVLVAEALSMCIEEESGVIFVWKIWEELKFVDSEKGVSVPVAVVFMPTGLELELSLLTAPVRVEVSWWWSGHMDFV